MRTTWGFGRWLLAVAIWSLIRGLAQLAYIALRGPRRMRPWWPIVAVLALLLFVVHIRVGAPLWLTAIPLAVVAAVAVYMHDYARGHPRLERRWYHFWAWGNPAPRPFAHVRDLRRSPMAAAATVMVAVGISLRRRPPEGLVTRRARPNHFYLGRRDYARVEAPKESHVVLCAKTGAWKTRAFAVRWVCEHEGPVVATSIRRDLFDLTRTERERVGEVRLFSPFHPDSCGWDPLAGCDDWSNAQTTASYLADVIGGDGSHDHRFWNRQAAKQLLASYVHAAALEEPGRLAGPSPAGIHGLMTWLDEDDPTEPMEILEACGATTALARLYGYEKMAGKQRSSLKVSADDLVRAYDWDAVRDTARPDLDLEALVTSTDCLQISALAEHQRLLAPLIVMMFSRLFRISAERYAEHGKPLDPVLRLVLDEVANMAPLGQLPEAVSTVRALGVQLAMIIQNIAQLQRVWGDGAHEILDQSVRVFAGPQLKVSAKYLREQLGTTAARHYSRSLHPRLGHQTGIGESEQETDIASEERLRRIPRGQAIVLVEPYLPALVRYSPYRSATTAGEGVGAATDRAPAVATTGASSSSSSSSTAARAAPADRAVLGPCKACEDAGRHDEAGGPYRLRIVDVPGGKRMYMCGGQHHEDPDRDGECAVQGPLPRKKKGRIATYEARCSICGLMPRLTVKGPVRTYRLCLNDACPSMEEHRRRRSGDGAGAAREEEAELRAKVEAEEERREAKKRMRDRVKAERGAAIGSENPEATDPSIVTWTTLRDGTRGIRGPAWRLREGRPVAVTSPEGDSRSVRVGRIVWSDGQTAIAAIEDSEERQAA
jgi:type IV secretion system protein VirD4